MTSPRRALRGFVWFLGLAGGLWLANTPAVTRLLGNAAPRLLDRPDRSQ